MDEKIESVMEEDALRSPPPPSISSRPSHRFVREFFLKFMNFEIFQEKILQLETFLYSKGKKFRGVSAIF